VTGWRGAVPYDRSQDRTAEQMRPVYEARGYQREPDAVRGFWDDMTDERYAWLFRYNTPEQLAGSLQSRGLDVACTDGATLAAAARIAVGWERERAAQAAAGERQAAAS
jgi:hypothetical protein